MVKRFLILKNKVQVVYTTTRRKKEGGPKNIPSDFILIRLYCLGIV